MAKTDRCPICNVAVKPENLLRHLNDTHPRHADTPALRERLKAEGRPVAAKRSAAAPIHVRRWHIAVLLLVVLLIVGAAAVAPYLDPNRTFSVDSCINETGAIYHIHVRLSIFTDGSRVPIPVNTGITPGCTKPIHTHADYDPATEPAVLHVESPVVRSLTLGDFFHVWGQPFSSAQVLSCSADANHVIRMTVNNDDSPLFGALVLVDGQQIVVTCGPP